MCIIFDLSELYLKNVYLKQKQNTQIDILNSYIVYNYNHMYIVYIFHYKTNILGIS